LTPVFAFITSAKKNLKNSAKNMKENVLYKKKRITYFSVQIKNMLTNF
jgi:hypothetical protein